MWTRRVLMNLQLFAKGLDWTSFEFDDIFSLRAKVFFLAIFESLQEKIISFFLRKRH